MNAMTVTHQAQQAQLRQVRARLAASPVAPREARARVRDAIRDWAIPVDEDVAVLLTSDLVTHAIRQETGESVTLAIRYEPGRLRVEVRDSSRSALGSADAPAPGAAAGGVLALVGSLSAEWGSYRTPAGLAWYFTLAFRPDLAVGAECDPQGNPRGDGE
jgi:hypothetical protein